MATAVLDGVVVTEDDHVFADEDGVLVVASADVDAVVATALEIQRVETAQAERMRRGESLRAQLDFAGYRRRQADDPELTLRRYLTERGGAIEV
jgi:4-hydroxy-4-methyl-2-oxoglutarate aldolase